MKHKYELNEIGGRIYVTRSPEAADAKFRVEPLVDVTDRAKELVARLPGGEK